MNKSYLSLLFVFAALIAVVPSGAHAAFTFTPSSANGDGQAYVAPNGTSASFNAPNPYAGVVYGTLDPLAACQAAASASGLSDASDTFCVFDADEEGSLAGSSFYGSGGGATGCNGTCSGNPPARGYGTWPPGADEWLQTGYFPETYVTLYQSPLTKLSLSTVLNAMDTYNRGLWNHDFAQSCLSYAQQNGLDASGCPADPGVPQDPGYSDVCALSHRDQKGNELAPNNINPTGPAAACSVYHHTGVVQTKPVATLTANPTSVVVGNSSLLTYSCSNSSTAASIDNGVGSLSPVAAGSKSVAPGATTTYTLTCTNAGGSSTATATVAVEPLLAGSCAVFPTSATTGASVTWSATASGGTGAYAYSWGGTDSLSGSSASVSKAYTTAGTKTGNVTITSGSQSITPSCSNSVTVTAPAASDLSASGITPSTATAGTPVSLSATIANTGTGSTGAGFTDLFQRATDSSGTGAADIGTYSNGALAANGSNAASLSYTFSSAGTFYVRACADKSSAGNAGVIAESNEGNNCGPWTAVTVATAAQPTPTCSLSASPSTVPSTLTWSSTNATSCTGGGFSTGNATSGSVSTSVSGAYTVTCTGTGGTCSASTNVGGGACTNPTLTLTGNPDRVKPGTTTTVNYSATGVTSCTLSGPGAPAVTPNSCSLPQGSFTTPAITTQTTYTLTCDSVSKTLIINVLPKIIEF